MIAKLNDDLATQDSFTLTIEYSKDIDDCKEEIENEPDMDP